MPLDLEGRMGEGIVGEFEMDMSTLLYFKWSTTATSSIAQGTQLNALWQPGWMGGKSGGYVLHSYGWDTLLSTWNYHNIVSWLCCCLVTKSCLTLCDPMDNRFKKITVPLENGISRLVQCRVVTNLQFVKKQNKWEQKDTVSVKCNKVEHNKTKYAYSLQHTRIRKCYTKLQISGFP